MFLQFLCLIWTEKHGTERVKDLALSCSDNTLGEGNTMSYVHSCALFCSVGVEMHSSLPTKP